MGGIVFSIDAKISCDTLQIIEGSFGNGLFISVDNRDLQTVLAVGTIV